MVAVKRLGAIVVAGAMGLVVASLGTPGLVVLSILVLSAMAIRSIVLSLLAAAGAIVALAVWTVAFVRCEPTMGRTCTLDDGSGMLLLWAAIAAVLGLVTAGLLARANQHPYP